MMAGGGAAPAQAPPRVPQMPPFRASPTSCPCTPRCPPRCTQLLEPLTGKTVQLSTYAAGAPATLIMFIW